MTLRLSNSEMKLFRRCRRQWYLTYYRWLKPRQDEEPYSASSIGTVVHDALAAYYADRIDPAAHAEQVLDGKLEANPTLAKDIEKERGLVVAMLVGYMEWLEDTGADADLEIEGTESMVEVELTQQITLLSKLDAPVRRRSDGARLALEHKTVQSLDQPLVTLKMDTQCLTEHLARFLHAKERGMSNEDAYEQCHGVLYNMMRKVKRTASAKPPFYGREPVEHNIHELRSHWLHCVAIGNDILAARARLDAGEGHHLVCPPNPTRDDSWDNRFFPIFVMMDDGSDWESAVEAMYEVRDPLDRYKDSVPL